MGFTEEKDQSHVSLGLLTSRSLSPDVGRGADAEREGAPEVARRAHARILDYWRAPGAGGRFLTPPIPRQIAR